MAAEPETRVVIDPDFQHQTLEGWGMNLAWWGNTIGSWKDKNSQEIGALLFGDDGLDMNIVRYNIGGGENPNHNHMNSGAFINAEMEGYQPEEGQWNWNGDSGQQAMLQIAKENGANIYEAFANSAPYWMTVSGCAAGNFLSAPNFKTSYTDKFADYLSEVVLKARDDWGIDFRTVDAFNEPDGFWHQWRPQEGMVIIPNDQKEVVKSLRRSLDSKGLLTEITAMDVWSKDNLMAQFNGYDSEAKDAVSQLNVHSYSGSNQMAVNQYAQREGKRLWMSEYGCGSGHDHNNIASATTLASTIIDDMRNMKPNAWLYWQPVENEEEREDSYGFIHANYRGDSHEYYITKQYYAFGQFSKFIKQGYKMIEINDENCLAAYDKATQKLVVVALNNTGSAISKDFDLSLFDNTGSSVETYRTSAEENLTQVNDAVLSNMGITTQLAPNSITTYVVNDIEFTPKGVITDISKEQFTLSGDWDSTGDVVTSNSYDDAIQLNFVGTGIELYGQKSPQSGMVGVSIDGGAEIYIDLYAPQTSNSQYIFSSSKLSSGAHTLRARVTNQKNPESTDYFVSVSSAKGIEYRNREIVINNIDTRDITDLKIGLDFYVNGQKYYDYEELGNFDSTIYTSLTAEGGRNDGLKWVGDFITNKGRTPGEKKLVMSNLESRQITGIRVHVDFKVGGKWHYDYEDIANFDGITSLSLNAENGKFNGIKWVGDFLVYSK